MRHGTWFYGVGSVLASGQVALSWNENLGHECWKPAVYTTPLMCTATRYARPHLLFSDAVYYRVVLELRVDDRRKIKKRQAGGHQILFPADAVHVRAVWVRPNAPPCVAEERLSSWNPELEALPAGRQAPRVVRNQRNLDARPWTGVTVAADARYPPPALP